MQNEQRDATPSSSESGSSESMWWRRLSLERGDRSIKLKVEEEWGAGIGGTLWEGAVLLARYLSCEKTFPTEQWRGARCIELGAGATGIPGILAAQLVCFREVVITDIDECMERLRDNVAANLASCARLADETPAATAAADPAQTAATAAEAAAADLGGREADGSSGESAGTDALTAAWDGRTSVRVCDLDWRQGCAHLLPTYEVVLVADVLYAEELVEPLLETMRFLSSPQSLVAIAIYNRDARASACFWTALPQYFPKWAKVPEADFGSPSQPDDIGVFLLYR